MPSLQAGYVLDRAEWLAENAAGRNYWWAYIAEVLERLGLSARELSPGDMPEALHELCVLFVGAMDLAAHVDDLNRWVRAGGVLIGSGTEGLDGLFGNESPEHVAQAGGDFSASAELRLRETPFSTGIHSPVFPDDPLLVASDLRLVTAAESTLVAEIDGRAAIAARQLGEGWAFYLGFDIAKTCWVIQQGRPVDRDYDGDGLLRTMDAIVIQEHPPEIAYTDELLFLLQNMLSVTPYPLLHQLPPDGDVIPDFVLYYGGDDEGATEHQMNAAEFMASRGLPYHINCMMSNGRFGVTPADVEKMASLGTESALHFNFMDGFPHPCGFTKDDVQQQVDAFIATFGFTPILNVAHCCRWTGWAEPAIWMSEAGLTADGSYAHYPAISHNPTNLTGFSFGTSYPFHFWTDHSHGNKRLDFIEAPITGYELGYEDDRTDPAAIEQALALAHHYQATLSFFYHPYYVSEYPACRAAIDTLLQKLRESDWTVLHKSPNELALWWLDRGKSEIGDVRRDGEVLRFTASTPAPQGIIVKIALGDDTPKHVAYPHRVIQKFGRSWLLIALPQGRSTVEIELG